MSVIFTEAKNAPAKGWLYREFQNGYVNVDGYDEAIAVDLVKVEQNSKSAWQTATSSKSNCRCRIYEVVLETRNELDTALENLQYFFIRADRATERKSREQQQENVPQLGILIHISARDLYRLQVFFAMQTAPNPRYNLLYTILEQNSPLQERRCFALDTSYHSEKSLHFGNLLPLIRIVKAPHITAAGEVLLADLLHSQTYKIDDEDIRSCLVKEDFSFIGAPEHNLRDCYKALLQKTSQAIAGTPQHQMHASDKQLFREQLSQFIISKRKHMSFFAEFIWLFCLQSLVQIKHLLIPKERKLNIPLLQQSYMDALAYSDGFLQILENSCQHSPLHSAYLSMRLRYVDRSGTDNQLLEAMQNRNYIVKHYVSSNIAQYELERDAKYYMCVSIIDDARSGSSEHMGILTTYRQNLLNRNLCAEAALPATLKDVFEDCGDFMAATPEGIIHHYGIQALKQIVLKHRGMFNVVSPYQKSTEFLSIMRSKNDDMLEAIYDYASTSNVGEQSETSEYHILCPLGMMDNELPACPDKQFDPLFETDGLKKPLEHTISTRVCQALSSIPRIVATCYMDQEEKVTATKKIAHAIESEQNSFSDLTNAILLFDLRELNDLKLEMFSKALFSLLLKPKADRRLYALLFDTPLQQQVFIRWFAIFYRRAHSKQSFPQGLGTQIALCSINDTLNIPEVNMILNMKNWNSLLESARRYAYCNIESGQEIYGQLSYLCQWRNCGEILDTAMFPFDLYLQELSDTNQLRIQIAHSSNSWFMQRIAMLIDRDLQSFSLGTKISGVHVYLSSNIHLEAFYEAEQLFHSAAYVCRFAYMLALRLRKNGYSYEGHNTLIVCYEAYSNLLAQYLAYYLQEAHENPVNIQYATMYQEKRGHSKIVMPPHLSHASRKFVDFNEWRYITLCPIGTTLSTIHSLHYNIEKETRIHLKPAMITDLVLILVADNNITSDLQKRYWNIVGINHDQVFPKSNVLPFESVQLAGQYSPQEWRVHIFLMAKTAWHSPEDCLDVAHERTLVYADSTSTAVNMIFPIKNQEMTEVFVNSAAGWQKYHQHDVCSLMKYSEQKANDARIALLEGCVYYGHIALGHNHYAYYIDIPRYYERIRKLPIDKKAPYWKWLQSLKRNAAVKRAVNIIVTPLRASTSPLLKDIVDCVFDHGAHILQIDLHNVRRSDVRTKYLYIALECEKMRRVDPSAQINVYYVDDSVVTAEMLQRGLSLVKMLLWDSNVAMEKNDIHIYSDIYVLINRSSRDTIQTFVNDPDNNFHAFVHIANPNYNTRNNSCPACRRVEKYKLLTRQSATNSFAVEYQRLTMKHELRMVDAYLEWQKDQVMVSPSAYLRLRQWIYNTLSSSKESKNSDASAALLSLGNMHSDMILLVKNKLVELQNTFYRKFCSAHDISQDQLFARLCSDKQHSIDAEHVQQQLLTDLEKLSLQRSVAYSGGCLTEEERQAFEFVWLYCVLADKAHRRLVSTHTAYCKILLEKEYTTASAVQIMKDRLIAHLMPVSSETPINNWETLHSNLKVLSRDIPARHHLVREAIFELLKDAADLMLGKTPREERMLGVFAVKPKSTKVPTLESTANCPIDPLLRYQMYYSIVRRLSNMQSSYIIHTLADGIVQDKLQRLTHAYFHYKSKEPEAMDYWFSCSLPSYEQMIFDYEKCVKLAAMAEDDENKSLLIQRMQIRSSSDT